MTVTLRLYEHEVKEAIKAYVADKRPDLKQMGDEQVVLFIADGINNDKVLEVDPEDPPSDPLDSKHFYFSAKMLMPSAVDTPGA